MVLMSLPSAKGRGTKRSRQDESSTPSSISRPKRARRDEGERGILGQFRKIGCSCLNWIVDRFGGNRQRGPNPAESMNDEEQTVPIDMRQAKPELDTDDEVQIVAEKLGSASALPSPLKFGTMSYGPLGQRQKHFTISTEEKRAKERLAKKPNSILGKVRNSNINATKKPPLINSFWIQHTSNNPSYFREKFPLQKTIAKQRTPKIGYSQAFNREDHMKYSAILFGGTPDVLPRLFSCTKKRRSLFHKKASEWGEAITVTKVGAESEPEEKKQPELVILDDDDEVDVVPKTKEIKDKTNEDVVEILNVYSPPKRSTKKRDVRRSEYLDTVQLEMVVQEDFLEQLRKKYVQREQENCHLIREEKVRLKHSEERRQKIFSNTVEERLRKHLKITEVAIPEPPEPEEEEEEEEEEPGLPEITCQMEEQIKAALSTNGTVIDAHKIPITRNDLDTLRGLNWLNDEIINFYLQMIAERSNVNDNWPKVYATNTFFYPKLMQSGHAALKRWTRKVDIFEYDLILIPVHLGMHWCLATIDLKKRGVYYYDSMLGDNAACLSALLRYLQDEHMDKKKLPFDTSEFTAEIVKEIPQQMNGSDCGMFTCKFAEYLSRNSEISFSQEDMPYFRRRMMWEISKNRLLHP